MGSSHTKNAAKDPEVEEIQDGQMPISPTDIPSSIPQEERNVATTSISDIETKIDLSASGNVDPSNVESRTKNEKEDEKDEEKEEEKVAEEKKEEEEEEEEKKEEDKDDEN